MIYDELGHSLNTRRLALCAAAENDPEEWFYTEHNRRSHNNRAVRVCHECPMRAACARAALSTSGDLYGVWAGVPFDRDSQPRGRLKSIAERSVSDDVHVFVARVANPHFSPHGTMVPESTVQWVRSLPAPGTTTRK